MKLIKYNLIAQIYPASKTFQVTASVKWGMRCVF